jgi:UDP-N-acetylmuramyl pentapeptide synthase
MGEYTISGYEKIGKDLGSVSDILFAVGPRTNFIALSAKKNGMAEENVLHYNDYEEFKNNLKEKICEEDFVFIDGSSDMEMERISNIIRKK